MPPLFDQSLQTHPNRTYDLFVPDNPLEETVPAIIVFHGGGQDVQTIEARWGFDPANPTNALPPPMDRYLLVFPEADPRLGDEWVHYHSGDSGFSTYDLDFVTSLLSEIKGAQYSTNNVTEPTVRVNAERVYAAGFSNGGGMAWQLMNSDLVTEFRGFAAVAKPLDPEKADYYKQQLPAGDLPVPVPTIYVHGTGDTGFGPSKPPQAPLDTTLPAFTVQEMLRRNSLTSLGDPEPNDPATTTIVSGSTNITEVVVQLFDVPDAAFEYVTVIAGGHNWPSPATRGNPPVAKHFDATEEILSFWQDHADLPA